ncbi:MAG TPA: ABC transporter ATP-binding protein [Anaerolineales bacterium]|nr:ABC transporter ATP-binding protein [Anaerolineales bacterium]
METEIRLSHLSKTYSPRQRKGLFKSEVRTVQALKDVSLEIHPGEIFGLLGPNGAGKTTLIKCLTTLLLPSAGDAWVHGYHIVKEENLVRSSVGCMLMGERGLYWKLTGIENLEFFAALYHIPPADRRRRAREIINLLELQDLADRTVETYSSGQKMKLAFGKALINDAPVLILDEPTNTLDVPSARELRAVVRQLNGQGKTVLYTTHIMSEAETLCDRVAIIDQGEVIAMDTVEELKASMGREQVTQVEGVISSQASQAVEALPGVSRVAISAVNGTTRLTVVAENTRALLPRLIETLTAHEAVVQHIAPQEVTLEDVFVAKTGRTLAQDTRVIGHG